MSSLQAVIVSPVWPDCLMSVSDVCICFLRLLSAVCVSCLIYSESMVDALSTKHSSEYRRFQSVRDGLSCLCRLDTSHYVLCRLAMSHCHVVSAMPAKSYVVSAGTRPASVTFPAIDHHIPIPIASLDLEKRQKTKDKRTEKDRYPGCRFSVFLSASTTGSDPPHSFR